ncbi:hypothetical protein PI125_g25823 [Phytophthora idaei]|nr:hypothetical protein PI125_g25823 [Phytophthora idaei]
MGSTGAGVTSAPEGASLGNLGAAPVQATATSTVGSGTSSSDPALQAFLMETITQALRMYSTSSSASMPASSSQTIAPVSRPVTGLHEPVVTPSVCDTQWVRSTRRVNRLSMHNSES